MSGKDKGKTPKYFCIYCKLQTAHCQLLLFFLLLHLLIPDTRHLLCTLFRLSFHLSTCYVPLICPFRDLFACCALRLFFNKPCLSAKPEIHELASLQTA